MGLKEGSFPSLPTNFPSSKAAHPYRNGTTRKRSTKDFFMGFRLTESCLWQTLSRSPCPACGARWGLSHYFFTTSRRALAAVNLGALVAGILMGLPVRGFTP
jgi:hypothetical protein